MTSQRPLTLVLLSCAMAPALAGCPQPCPVELHTRRQLIDEHNRNAAKVPSLWAVAHVEIRTADGKRYALSESRLLLRKRPEGPQDFMLRGREIGREFFRLGIDAGSEECYFWLNAARDGAEGNGFARWARIDDLNRPGFETFPIDPTQLLNVLGIMAWHVTGDRTSQLVYTPMTDPCVYDLFLMSSSPHAGRPYPQWRVWLDRRDPTHPPKRVWLYDRQGRCVLAATLSRHEKIETKHAKETWPVMPTDILMRWPMSKNFRSVRIRLSQPTTEGGRRVAESLFRDFRDGIPRNIKDARELGPTPEPAPQQSKAIPQ